MKFIKIPHLTILESFKEIGRNPFVDWAVIVIISSIIAIITIASSVILYKKVVAGDFQGKNISDNVQLKTFNKTDLANIIMKFDEKSTIRTQIKSGR